MKLFELTPVFLDEIPSDLENGKLYISRKFEVAIHLCACGCRQKSVTPIRNESDPNHWKIIDNNGIVSLSPSIGNFSGENPYHAHYYITENKIVWC